MNSVVWVRAIAVFILVCFCVPLESRTNSAWEIIGPGGGGAMFHPTISPRDPNHVLFACDMTGAYSTTDGGRSWRSFNLRGTVRFFAFDPLNDHVIYAASIGLWRSSDGGHTWRLIYPEPTEVTGVVMQDDHAGEMIVTASGAPGKVTALAIDPADSNSLYAAVQRGKATTLQLSSDAGKSWRALAELPEPVRAIYIDPQSPPMQRKLYLPAEEHIIVVEGKQWRTQAAPAGALRDVSAAFPRSEGPPVFYALSSDAIFISSDGGASWKKSEFPSPNAHFRVIAASPSNPDIAYVSYNNGDGKWFGVARTNDRGQHWELLWKESNTPAANVHDAWITKFFGPGYGENPLSLAVAPSEPNLVYSGDFGRVMRTTDGGKNWDELYSDETPAGGFTGRGIQSTTSYGVHFDPFEPQRMFISYTDIGLFRSDDGGKSWTSSIAGVPAPWRNTTYWMVFDPEVRGRVWAVMSATHDLPRTKMWARKSPADYRGGVVVSDDGGKSWRSSSDGMPQAAVTHILLDRSSPRNSRVLYVAAFGRGVYKSSDGGRSWTVKNNGIAGDEPFAWRLAQDTGGTLYLVLARRSDDGSIGNQGDGALYRSTDHAEHWERMNLPAGVNGPNGLAISPSDRNLLYLAAWGRNAQGTPGGGVYVSPDGGKTWRQSLAKDRHIYDVTIDDHNPKIVYAAGFESSAWRSADAGNTWERIPGFNFKWAHRVISDPAEAKRIYITTFGSSVWHGPAQGVPSAEDEIATPALAHSKR